MSDYYDHLFRPPPGCPVAYYDYRASRRQTPRPATELSVEAIATAENLVAVLDGMRSRNGQSPGPDQVRYPDLGRREAFDVFRTVARAIKGGTYRPAAARKAKLPKGNGGTRTLSIRNIVDRVVASAVNEALTPFVEGLLLDGVHGFRPGRSPLTMLADLEATIWSTGRWVIVADDIRTAFDAVDLNIVAQDFQHIVTNDKVRDLINAIVRGADPTRRVGLDQGCPLSPVVLNVHLHRALDADAHALGAIPGKPTPWLRYADNIVVPCQDVNEGQQVLHDLRGALHRVGLVLKGEHGGQPVELRKGQAAEILGYLTYRNRREVRYRLPGRAWSSLQEAYLRAHDAMVPYEAARAALSGWIAARGPAFANRQDRSIAYALRLAAEAGHREMYSADVYEGECRRAWLRWRSLVRARRNHQLHAAQEPGSRVSDL